MSLSRIEMLLKMQKEKPEDPFFVYALGLEYLNSDRDKAKKLFEDLLKSNKDFLPTYYQLGKMYELEENFELALSVLRDGAELAKALNETKTLNEINSAILEIEYEI